MSVHKGGKVPMLLHPGEGKLEEWAKVNNPKVDEMMIPVVEAWELNERMYGDLQGLNKQEMMDQFGKEQVHIWRRSYDVAPPHGECLADTAARAIPYFEQNVLPLLKEGKNVFIAAHGNSLRAIIMELEGMTKEEIIKFELATGLPVIYEYVGGRLSRVDG
jgi:2,3-bisphosphoglycerate-dependent phosphoglycerate mutase